MIMRSPEGGDEDGGIGELGEEGLEAPGTELLGLEGFGGEL